MKKKITQNFVQVNHNLLATTKLNSTQKLFISYIIGWQKSNFICKETNNNLALKFGMTYGGMRSLISSLNKSSFFKAERLDFDNKTSTSGHKIQVDIKKLEEFLCTEKLDEETISTETEIIEDDSESIMQYHGDDIIDIEQVMTYLDFNLDEINSCKAKFKVNSTSFFSFGEYISKMYLAQKNEDYEGVIITDEQNDKFCKMWLD